MKNLILFAALILGSLVHADDGGIAVIDVLGVSPTTVINSTVKVYGGDAKALYEVLPVTAIPQIIAKSIAIASPSYVISINCYQDYERPTTGEARSDFMCEFNVNTRKGSHIDEDEVDKWKAEASSFTPYSRKSSDLAVLGIDPGTAPLSKPLYQFYGKNAEMLAKVLPFFLGFQSKVYRFNQTCQQNYKRPTTGEMRSDYMCTAWVERI